MATRTMGTAITPREIVARWPDCITAIHCTTGTLRNSDFMRLIAF